MSHIENLSPAGVVAERVVGKLQIDRRNHSPAQSSGRKVQRHIEFDISVQQRSGREARAELEVPFGVSAQHKGLGLAGVDIERSLDDWIEPRVGIFKVSGVPPSSVDTSGVVGNGAVGVGERALEKQAGTEPEGRSDGKAAEIVYGIVVQVERKPGVQLDQVSEPSVRGGLGIRTAFLLGLHRFGIGARGDKRIEGCAHKGELFVLKRVGRHTVKKTALRVQGGII